MVERLTVNANYIKRAAELHALFRRDYGTEDPSIGLSRERRNNYEYNSCLHAALHYLESNPVPITSACSIGGSEAAVFLSYGVSTATVIDSDAFYGLPLEEDSRVEFIHANFAPGTYDKQFSIVIASMLFDDGSELVTGWDSVEDVVNDRIQYMRRWDLLQEYSRECSQEERGFDSERVQRGLRIPDFCKEMGFDVHQYCDHIHFLATRLCFNQEGHEDMDLLRTRLMEHHFLEEDIAFVIEEVRPKLSKVQKAYVAYAQAMWNLVEPGGIFVFDGEWAEFVASYLDNATITIYEKHKLNHDDKVILAKKGSA
jgi:hypothetical protein